MTVTSTSGASGLAIRTADLRKTYKSSRGDVPAVRGLDLSVAVGQFFGLLGPNGAGKSTTIGMLTTLVLPTGGQAWVSGMDVVADPVGVKRRIGVVTQNNTLDMQLTVTENLEFRSRLFGLGPREATRRAGQLIDAFGLGDRRKAIATDLSGGQARRLLIARALVHRPEVLFLDEPTAGLDPQTRVNLWDILQVLHDQGQSILLTTHYMEEAEALCDRIAVVDHGEVLAAGRAAARAGTGSAVAALITEAPVPQPTLAKTFAAMMAREFRVLRRNAVGTFTRAVMQPLLFVFVFTYVMPKVGGGFMFGGASSAAGAGGAAASS